MRTLVRALLCAALGFALPLANALTAQAAPIAAAPTATSSFTVGTLHVDMYGSGPQSIVLIPGLGCGTWEWYGTIAHFAPRYTIYALTLPGFDGQPSTDKPLFATFSHDFWQLLDSHDIAKPYVVGHSLGGTLAIMLGEEHPEMLAGIVAVDGLPVFPAAAMMTPQQRTAQAATLQATIGNATPAQALASDTAYMTTIGTLDANAAPSLAALEAKSDTKAVGAWTAADISSDLRPALSKVAVPLTEVMPYASSPSNPYTQDQTQGFYQMLLTGAPQATVVPISPSKHFAMLDQPDTFYAIVAKAMGATP